MATPNYGFQTIGDDDKIDIVNAVNTPVTQIDSEIKSTNDSLDNEIKSTNDRFNSANTAINGKAPISHASTDTTYGVGNTSNYGHLKLTDSTGIAASRDYVYVETNKPMIAIGDSWGAGWSPDGNYKSWIDYLKDSFNVVDSSSIGGAGFYNGTTFAQQATTIANRLSEQQRDSIKYIIVGGGINDYGVSDDAEKGAIKNYVTIVNSYFKNATTIFFYMCIGTNKEKRGFDACLNSYRLGQAISEEIFSYPNMYFINVTPFLYRSSMFASDGFHPTDYGQEILGSAVCSALRGLVYSYKLNNTVLHFGLTNGNALSILSESIDGSISGIYTHKHYTNGTIEVNQASRKFDNVLCDPLPLIDTEYIPLLAMSGFGFTQEVTVHINELGFATIPAYFNLQYTSTDDTYNYYLGIFTKIVNATRDDYQTGVLTEIQTI